MLLMQGWILVDFLKVGGGGTSLGLGGVDSGCKLSQIASYRNFLRGSINKLKGTKVTTIVVCHLPTYRSFYPCMINKGKTNLKKMVKWVASP